ncbi:FCD domain-containing protein [Glutamicibacter sp. TV12E]|uniref:FCD domain-containing protein n=1 Tax=Glutamicibacter sp. TV12E TaxID=3446362 RepID=UPI004033D344
MHECVNQLAGNGLLLELHSALSARMRWLLVQHDDPQSIGREHAELFAALVARDEEKSLYWYPIIAPPVAEASHGWQLPRLPCGTPECCSVLLSLLIFCCK